MWLMTKRGFYSVVRKGKPGQYQIRARERHDLENLIAGPLHGHEIVKTPEADYPYRVVINQTTLAAVMAYLSTTVDYSNFKEMIHDTPDQRRKVRPYNQIWYILSSLLEPYR